MHSIPPKTQARCDAYFTSRLALEAGAQPRNISVNPRVPRMSFAL